MKRTLSVALSALILTACSGLDGAGKDACTTPDDCGSGRACQSMVCVDGDPALSDSDGDGLIDSDERAGWDIDVDERGYGLVVGSEFITRRQVVSDPSKPDTDGDGLNDKIEFNDRLDPSKPDTDGDGSSDGEEKTRWRSNPLSVDSDGDARDPNNNTIPLASLFDGAELMAGTSPTLADTDGDGTSDFDERDVSNRSPRVAEIPQAEIRVAGNITVQMNVEYSDAQMTSETYGEEYSTTDSSRTSRSDMESTAVTMAASSGGEGFFDDLELSKEGAIKFFGGKALEMGRSAACQSAASGQISFDSEHPLSILNPINLLGMLAGLLFEPTGILDDTGACDAPSPETVNTTSTTLTQESAQSATDSYSQYKTDSTSHTEVASTGIVSIGFRLRNVGISSFDLVNPTVTMMQWGASPVPDAAVGAGAFRTLATLRSIDGGVLDANGNRTFTLAPNEEVIVQMENREVNADFIKGFLARPEAIFFSPAQFRMSDRSGADFDYLTEQTYNRTAALVIDSGVASEPTQRYQFATNVMRTETGELAGISMHDVLNDVLQLPYETKAVERRTADGSSVMVEELHAIGNLANQRSANRGDPANGTAGDPQGFWVIYVKRQAQAAPDLRFDDIVFLPGDEVRLVYVRDVDGDGLMAREEAVYGTSDQQIDSDADGLSDFVELKVGWRVDIGFTLDGQSQTVGYRVGSDPANADPDGDGLSDPDERTLATDPNNPDTDDDGRFDRCDNHPLDPEDSSSNGRCEPVATYAYVGTGGSIQPLAIGGDGSLTAIGATGIAPPQGGIVEMALTPDGSQLYAAAGRNGQTPIHAFDLDIGTGELSYNPYPQLSLGSGGGLKNWRAVLVHPSGRFVFGADEGPDNDQVAAYAIDMDLQPGSLSYLNRDRDFSDVRQMAMDVSGRYLYVIDGNRELGIIGVDQDQNGDWLGTLSTIMGVNRVEFPSAIATSPAGRYLFLAEATNVVVPMIIDDATGNVSAVAGNYSTGLPYISKLVVDPTGSYLFSIASNSLFIHAINPSTGSLTELDADNDPNTGFTPWVTSVNDVAVGGAGKLLIVVGNSTRAFFIEQGGQLTPAGEVPGTASTVTILSRVP